MNLISETEKQAILVSGQQLSSAKVPNEAPKQVRVYLSRGRICGKGPIWSGYAANKFGHWGLAVDSKFWHFVLTVTENLELCSIDQHRRVGES
jgi:hypothetical protein